MLLTRSQDDFNKIKKDKWEYYTGKADPAVYQLKPFNLKLLRQDVDKYIESDDEWIKSEIRR